jgi:pimeloyl-ACP methyl ester carboxylesterase
MIGQMRDPPRHLSSERGGRYEEVVFDNCGHSPHLERAPAFLAALHNFLAGT